MLKHGKTGYAVLALVAGVSALAATSVAIAQTLEASTAALARAKRDALLADRRSARLEAKAAAATDEAARARASEAAVAARIQAAEAEINAAEARIALVERLRARQRARLAARQGPTVRLVAALQIMSRRPPALALVQPGSMQDLAHVRALLGSQLPLVRTRTAGLRAAVAEGVRLREQADHAVATLRTGRERLNAERVALARIEAKHLVRSQALIDGAMRESDRAMALGEEARDIVDLMGELDEQASVRDRLATLPGPMLRPPLPGNVAAPVPEPVRTAAGRAPYRLPVVGRVVTGLGEVSEAGVRARGLTLATRPGARVVAPRAGRIAYAGEFRRYGRIVIIDHGGGWTTLITDLAALDVHAGEEISQGSPIGRAGNGRPTVTVELRKGEHAVDITPLVAMG